LFHGICDIWHAEKVGWCIREVKVPGSFLKASKKPIKE